LDSSARHSCLQLVAWFAVVGVTIYGDSSIVLTRFLMVIIPDFAIIVCIARFWRAGQKKANLKTTEKAWWARSMMLNFAIAICLLFRMILFILLTVYLLTPVVLQVHFTVSRRHRNQKAAPGKRTRKLTLPSPPSGTITENDLRYPPYADVCALGDCARVGHLDLPEADSDHPGSSQHPKGGPVCPPKAHYERPRPLSVR